MAVSNQQRDDLEFSSVFSTRKPRDLGAGLASGAKSVAKGVLAGAIGLVAAPAIGAHQEGLKGFAKGAAAGLAGAVILPVTGVAVGTAQVVRGAVNTPEAIKQASQGKHWDEDSRRWIEPPGQALTLDGDAQRAARAQWRRQQQRTRGRNGSNARGEHEEDFYELLGVERDATAEEIKRQYYLLARRMHPDKNPGDPEANAKFQKLGEAYQVLGNEELRKRYDAHGAEGLDVNYVDGAEFFTALFGSDRFEHLVGELMLAAAARNGCDFQPAQLRRQQFEREKHLVQCLGALLMRYEVGDVEGFQEAMTAEAAELATLSFGDVMLKAIGGVYKAQADIHLGGILDGSLALLRAKGRGIKAQFSAASLALKVYQKQQEIARLDAVEQQAKQEADQQQQAQAQQAQQQGIASMSSEQDDGQPGSAAADQQPAAAISAGLAAAAAAAAAERARLEEQSLPLMLEAMWAANRLDIESTLRHVCKQLLNDVQLDKAHRRLRAEALRELGNIFMAAAQKGAAEKAARAAAPDSSSTNGHITQQQVPPRGGAAPASTSAANGSKAAEQRRQQREAEELRRREEKQRAAKEQMEAALQAVMQRRMQQEDAAH